MSSSLTKCYSGRITWSVHSKCSDQTANVMVSTFESTAMQSKQATLRVWQEWITSTGWGWENQVLRLFNTFQGIGCLISTNRNFAWAGASQALWVHIPITLSTRFKWNKCIRCWWDVPMKLSNDCHYKSNRPKVIIKHVQRRLSQSIITTVYFIKPSVSGPLELIVGHDTPNWAAFLPGALYY